MANVLQDYFDRMTALNRQRGMTGNMQYGKAIDSSLAEGYFDSYEKNKGASENRANQKAQLAIMQQNANTSRYQVDTMKDIQKNQNMWQGLGMGLNAVAVGAKAYGDIRSQNKGLPMPEKAITYNPTPAEWDANQWSAKQIEGGANGVQFDFSQLVEPMDTTYEWDMSGDIGWTSLYEPDFASSISTEAGF